MGVGQSFDKRGWYGWTAIRERCAACIRKFQRRRKLDRPAPSTLYFIQSTLNDLTLNERCLVILAGITRINCPRDLASNSSITSHVRTPVIPTLPTCSHDLQYLRDSDDQSQDPITLRYLDILQHDVRR